MSSHETLGSDKVTRMTQIGLLIAIEVVMTFTPLGFIMIPFLAIKATLVHIPVIVGGVLLGPGVGAVLGGVFGLCSILNNTLYPGPTSFVFSPFLAVSVYGAAGFFKSLVLALLPRILVGVVAGLVAKGFREHPLSKGRCFLAGIAGSLTNTILVMGGIYLLYGQVYAETIGQSYQLLLAYIMGVVAVNGTCEALLAAVISMALVPILAKVVKRRSA